MAIYVIIDTNVVVSAMLSEHHDAATVQVLSAALNGDVHPILSREVLDEYDSVLHRSKFSFKEKDIEDVLTTLIEQGSVITPQTTNHVLPDIKDLPFYELFMGGGISKPYLITGNRNHFPENPRILTPRQMIDVMESGFLAHPSRPS